MKKLFTLSLALLTAVPFYAQVAAVGYSVKESYSYKKGEEKPDLPSTNYNFFDAKGYQVMEIGGSIMVNTFDDNGLKIKSTSYSSNYTTGEYSASSSTEFVYDAQNQVEKTISYGETGNITGYVFYENYVNGLYQDMKTIGSDGVSITYWRSTDHTFVDGRLSYTIGSYHPNFDETKVVLDSTVYIYTDGVCTGSVQYQYDGKTYGETPVANYSYSYDTTGRLIMVKNVSETKWGTFITEDEYIYNILSADYVAQNLVVKEKSEKANVLEISWDAPKNAVSGYRLIIDGVLQENTTATSFETSTLVNGLHQVSLVSVADGEIKNMTGIQSIVLNDEGVKPATDFTVVSMAGKTTVDGSEVYPVTVSWKAPVTESTIKSYYVYYSEYSYQEVAADQTTATLNLPIWVCETNGIDGIEGVDVTLFVKVVYTTGTSEKSNEIIANPFNNEWSASIAQTSVETTTVKAYPTPAVDCLYLSAPASVKIYNAAGVLVLDAPVCSSVNVSSLASGYYFLQGVDAEGNTFSQKVVIK